MWLVAALSGAAQVDADRFVVLQARALGIPSVAVTLHSDLQMDDFG